MPARNVRVECRIIEMTLLMKPSQNFTFVETKGRHHHVSVLNVKLHKACWQDNNE